MYPGLIDFRESKTVVDGPMMMMCQIDDASSCSALAIDSALDSLELGHIPSHLKVMGLSVNVAHCWSSLTPFLVLLAETQLVECNPVWLLANLCMFVTPVSPSI